MTKRNSQIIDLFILKTKEEPVMSDTVNRCMENQVESLCEGMDEKILYHNEWMSLAERDGWVYAKESRGNCEGIAILPYADLPGGEREYLGIEDKIAAHGFGTNIYSITGIHDDLNETMEELAVKELFEEVGYVVDQNNLIPLGIVKPSKGMDMTRYLFAVDVVNADFQTPPGDETGKEVNIVAMWLNKKDAMECVDPLMSTMILRLEDRK